MWLLHCIAIPLILSGFASKFYTQTAVIQDFAQRMYEFEIRGNYTSVCGCVLLNYYDQEFVDLINSNTSFIIYSNSSSNSDSNTVIGEWDYESEHFWNISKNGRNSSVIDYPDSSSNSSLIYTKITMEDFCNNTFRVSCVTVDSPDDEATFLNDQDVQVYIGAQMYMNYAFCYIVLGIQTIEAVIKRFTPKRARKDKSWVLKLIYQLDSSVADASITILTVANAFYVTSTSYNDQNFVPYVTDSFYNEDAFIVLQVFVLYYMGFWVAYLYVTRIHKKHDFSKFLLAIGFYQFQMAFERIENAYLKYSLLVFMGFLYLFGGFSLFVAFSSKLHSINFIVQISGSFWIGLVETFLDHKIDSYVPVQIKSVCESAIALGVQEVESELVKIDQ